MKFKVIKPFSWAHRGVDVVSYEENEALETDDADLISVGLNEGWIEKEGKAKPEVISNKAHTSPGQKETLLDKAKKYLKN